MTIHDEVLVVGAGPTGLTLALALTRQNVPVRVVDAGEGPSVHSKALAVHARTLEELELLGVADTFVEAGLPVRGLNLYSHSERLAHVDIEGIESPYPYILVVPQNVTERILAAELDACGVDVEWSTRVTDFHQTDYGVGTTFTLPDGSTSVSTYPWVVGCDGAHSTVRQTLRVGFDGETISQWFGLADLSVDWEAADDEATVFLAPQGVLGFIPLPEKGRYRLVATFPDLDPDDSPELDLEVFRKIFADRSGLNGRLSDPGWISSFMVRERLVPRYDYGRVFLAGDAAHIHSPAGGQGMNTGMQDACNLAWKLALVFSGRAHHTLLESYHEERRPVAEAVIRGTGGATRLGTVENALVKAVRNALANVVMNLDAVQQRMLARVSMLSVAYPDSPIVGQWRDSLLQARVGRSDSEETPNVPQWFDFGSGPDPGGRAPDAPLLEGISLFDLFGATHHTLLLFDGVAQTAEGYQRLTEVVSRIREQFSGLIEPYVVVSGDSYPEALGGELPVVFDPTLDAHRAYGAGAECLYLVRPDGYIAWRSQPADRERLLDFLGRLLADPS